MTPMFQNFDPTSLGSWGSAGLDVLDLPGALARGLLAGRPGERVSGEELLRGWGDQDPGAFASTLTSMATDPLSYLALGGPALRLLRGGAEAAEGVNAARTATPFLKSAAFGFGAPLAGAAVMDANKDYQNPMANALATGLMVSPLAIHAPGMLAGAGRRLAGLAGFGNAAGAAEAAEGVGAAGAAGAGSAGAIPPMAAADFATQHGIPGRAPMLPGGEGYEGHQANSALNPNFQQAIAGMPQNIEAQHPAPGEPLGPEHFEHNQIFEGLPQHEMAGAGQASAISPPAMPASLQPFTPPLPRIPETGDQFPGGGFTGGNAAFTPEAWQVPTTAEDLDRYVAKMGSRGREPGIPQRFQQSLPPTVPMATGRFESESPAPASSSSLADLVRGHVADITAPGAAYATRTTQASAALGMPHAQLMREVQRALRENDTPFLQKFHDAMTGGPGVAGGAGGAGGAGVATGDALDKLIGTVGTPQAPSPMSGVPTPAVAAPPAELPPVTGLDALLAARQLPGEQTFIPGMESEAARQGWLPRVERLMQEQRTAINPNLISQLEAERAAQQAGTSLGTHNLGTQQGGLSLAQWAAQNPQFYPEAIAPTLASDLPLSLPIPQGVTPPIIPQLEGPKPPMPFGELMHTPTSDLADTKVNVPPLLAAAGVPQKFMDAITRSATLGNKRPALMERVAQILAEERPEAQSKSTAEATGYGPAMQAKAKIGSPLPVMPGWQGRKNMTDPWPMNSDRIAELENVFTRGRAGNMEDVATDPETAHAKQLAESINATALGDKLNPADNVGKRGTGNTRENELLAILVKRNKLSPDSPKYAEKYAELTKKAEDFYYREKKLKSAYDIQDEHRISAPVAQLAQDLKGQSPTEGFIQPPSDLRAAIEGRIARKEPAILNTRIPVRQPGESQAAFMYRVAHDFATTPEPEIEMERSQAAAAALGQERHPFFPRMEVTKGGEELAVGQELPENNSWTPGTRNDFVQKSLDLPLDNLELENALVPGAAPTAEQLAQQSLQEELKLSKLPGMGYRPGVPTPAPQPTLAGRVIPSNIPPIGPVPQLGGQPGGLAGHLGLGHLGYQPPALDPALLDRLMRATGLTPAMLMMLLAGGGGAGGAAALARGLLGRQYQQQAA